MYPPIFATCNADSGVQGYLGVDPMRFFMFGQAPQFPTKPYAVWQVVGGVPENYVSCMPDIDSYTVQVDVYAESGNTAREVTEALLGAIEPEAYLVNRLGEGRENDTFDYRSTFLVDWIVNR